MSSPHLNDSAFADPLIKDLFSVMFISIKGIKSGKSVIKAFALQNKKMYMDMDSILRSEKVLIFISYALSSVIKHSNNGNIS